MKIAIVERKGSFSDGWICYCESKNIEYKFVNPYNSDVIQQIAGCDAFMWHFHQADYRDMQIAVPLLTSLYKAGLRVFPNPDTCWHFDNKVAEKYLFESIGAPMVPSYVFYTKKEAMEWIANASFPKVFKLKGGAGSCNVKLAHSRKEAKSFVKRAFGKGFTQYDWRSIFWEQLRKYRLGQSTLRELLRPIYYATKRYPTAFAHYHQNEIGYVYFQDFIPGNNHDIRVCIVDDKAFALRRNCRDNDFRASGSGSLEYDVEKIDRRCVEISFAVNRKLACQSVAFDFVFDTKGKPLIVECSYGFAPRAYDLCEGYWTQDMSFHKRQSFDFCGWMVENLIR